MTAAETLRRAAEKLREVGGAATPGPWRAERVRAGDLLGIAVTAPDERTGDGSIVGVTDIVVPSDAQHIATAHPGFTLAVADLLDTLADWLDDEEFEIPGVPMDWSASTGGVADRANAALAVARQVLGEDER